MKYRKITIDLELGDRIKHLEIDNEIELKEYYKMKNKIDELQQENERLKQSLFKSVNNTNKAIEEINYWGIDKEHNDNSAMRLALGNILNILNGSDKQ